jgi:hypothetical protein
MSEDAWLNNFRGSGSMPAAKVAPLAWPAPRDTFLADFEKEADRWLPTIERATTDLAQIGKVYYVELMEVEIDDS